MVTQKMKKLKLSEEYWKRAQGLIPAGTQTLSKGPTQWTKGVAPKYLNRGKGAYVWDVDGNKYIDYAMGLGAITLGYAYPEIESAIKKQLKYGTVFSLMHPLEVEASEMLKKTISFCEMVRFAKNGSDVTSAAIRVARSFTKKDKVAICGYHGWQDWYIGTTDWNYGVPQAVKSLSLKFEYNKIETLHDIFKKNRNEIAAVIMEAYSTTLPEKNFLEEVKEITHKNGAVLIFDEIVNGFRIMMGGASEYFKVIPDLATFGKGIANGMPIAALVGKKEIMKELESKVFFSTTFGGECLSLAALLATIKVYQRNSVLNHLWEVGKELKEGFEKIIKEMELEEVLEPRGLPPRWVIDFKNYNGNDSLTIKTFFQQEAIKRGILTSGYHNLSFSHTKQEIKKTLDVYQTVLEKLKRILKNNQKVENFLEGEKVKPVFRPI